MYGFNGQWWLVVVNLKFFMIDFLSIKFSNCGNDLFKLEDLY